MYLSSACLPSSKKTHELVPYSAIGIDLKHTIVSADKKVRRSQQSAKLSVCIVSGKVMALVTACGGSGALQGLINDPESIIQATL